MRCFMCGKGTLRPQIVPFTGEIRGESYTFDTPSLVCSKCGHQAAEGASLQETMRQLADAYREAHGLLTSRAIQQRRQALHMNQKEFAAYLKVGEASVKRWELGQVQDEAMNELILLKTDPVIAARNAADVASRLYEAAEEKTPIVKEPSDFAPVTRPKWKGRGASDASSSLQNSKSGKLIEFPGAA